MLVGGISSLREPRAIREVFFYWRRSESEGSARSSRITIGLLLQGRSYHIACHSLAWLMWDIWVFCARLSWR